MIICADKRSRNQIVRGESLPKQFNFALVRVSSQLTIEQSTEMY